MCESALFSITTKTIFGEIFAELGFELDFGNIVGLLAYLFN